MDLDYTNWWERIEPEARAVLAGVLIPIGTPGHAGAQKAQWQALLDERFGDDGWRIDHYVRGQDEQGDCCAL